MSSSPVFVAAPRTPCVSIANADASAYKTVMAAGSNGSRVDCFSAVNSDAANAYVLTIAIQKGSSDFRIGEVTVPAGAGTNGSTKAVNLLNSVDLPQMANTLNVLFLETGTSLRVRSKTTVSGVNVIELVAAGGDY